MHASSYENMARCVRWYVGRDPGTVADLGAMNVNGTYRTLFPEGTRYVGVDLEPGPGVDVVLNDVYTLPFDDESLDLVITGQMLEHCGQFWRVFSEIARVLKPGGLVFAIAPSTGPVHRYPVDCYRFYPDSYQAMADWAGLRLVHSWTDERGPWCDFTGVFQKGGTLEAITTPPTEAVEVNYKVALNEDPAAEEQRGARFYRDVLADIHAVRQPRRYLEIGVRTGASLAIADCPSIGIDPDPHSSFDPRMPRVQFFRCTSDDFFFFHGDSIDEPVDLAFIDGMHLAEYVYRDFINVERVMSPDGVIVIDDCFINHPLQGNRERQSRIWSGDVWRFIELLIEKRPDLQMTWLDSAPTGLLLVSNLSPRSKVLWENYSHMIRRLRDEQGRPVIESVLTRKRAKPPTIEVIRAAMGK